MLNSNLKVQTLNGASLLSIAEKGTYFINQPTDSPDSTAGYLFVTPYTESYRTIRWIPYQKSVEYINTYGSGTWKGWAKITTTTV